MGARMTSSGSWAIKGLVKCCLAVAAIVSTSSLASANTMTFGTGAGNIGYGPCCTPAPYTEDGISATPTVAPGSLEPGQVHFDTSDGAIYGASAANRVAVIHRGNGGEQVQFTFAGGNFDLQSVDITGWDIGPDPSLSGVFESSSGATFTVSSADLPPLLTIDFASQAGWSNISFFTFTVPVGVGVCGVDPAYCSGVGFDNIVLAAASTVPIPAALPLFISAIAGLGWVAWRRRSVVATA
jgi:hypothetical protein